jgi:hypothetical protein
VLFAIIVLDEDPALFHGEFHRFAQLKIRRFRPREQQVFAGYIDLVPAFDGVELIGPRLSVVVVVVFRE